MLKPYTTLAVGMALGYFLVPIAMKNVLPRIKG